MKANFVWPQRTSTLVFIAFLVLARGQAAVVPNSFLSGTRDSSGKGVGVTINDAGNNLWIIQSSTDLRNWTEAEAVKVYNGSFHRTFGPIADSPNGFFRAFFDPTRTDIS